MGAANDSLAGVRVLAALNGLELFGHERGNIEVFKALRTQGAEIIVGTNGKGQNHVDAELRRLGFVTFPLPFSNQWSLMWLRNDPLSIREKVSAVIECSRMFVRQVRQFKPTHIHLGSPLAYSYLSVALARVRIPLIYRMGDCPPVDSRFNLRLWRMAMRRSRKVVANSHFVADRAVDAGVDPDKVLVIHGLAPSRIERNERGASTDLRAGSDRLVYVGSLAEHKGLIPLVKAFTKLATELPSLKLDIVGGSRYDAGFRDRLISMLVERSLSSRVSFHGHVDDPLDYFRRAAIHVVPSIWEESAANVVLEAKREGTPSAVFPSGGLVEMVRHKIDGYVCRDKTADALAEAVRWLLADEIRLRRLRAAARDDFDARFGEARFRHAWADIYRLASTGEAA